MVRFLRLVVSVFFRQVSVAGAENIPPDGPVIFCGNHPNSLLDPLVIITTCGRKVHFAAKDTLFKNHALRVFLNALGCVPIFRKMDHAQSSGGPVASNEGTFRALHDVLEGGGAMGIFPEGISHDTSQLSRLKTGAARVALGLVKKNPELVVRLVPCGLTYVRRKRFRSRVLVQFGPPILIGTEQLREHEDEQRERVVALTAELDVAMRGLTVNAEDWETIRVLDAVRRLYQPAHLDLAQRVELARRFNAVYAEVRTNPDIVGLLARVGAYQERLDEAGLKDSDVTRELGPVEAGFRAALNFIRVAFWAPAALPGLVLHLPLGFAASWGGRHLTPRSDVTATTKLVIGMGLVMLTYAVLVLLAWLSGGRQTAFIVGLLLPVSGYATLRVLERGASIKRLCLHGWRAVALRRELKILRHQRQALRAGVLDAVKAYLPDDMHRMVADPRFTAEDLGH